MNSKIPEYMQEELKEKGGLSKILSSMPSSKLLRKQAQIYAALSDPLRLKILCFLGFQRSCVCLIREVVKISYSKLSYHLSILKKAKLIKGEKMGNYIIYSLTQEGREYYDKICGGE